MPVCRSGSGQLRPAGWAALAAGERREARIEVPGALLPPGLIIEQVQIDDWGWRQLRGRCRFALLSAVGLVIAGGLFDRTGGGRPADPPLRPDALPVAQPTRGKPRHLP
jgi:hypothetical protein